MFLVAITEEHFEKWHVYIHNTISAFLAAPMMVQMLHCGCGGA
jgi:hypothetical protein